ncbi:MAG: hypothetical protein ACOY4R_26050 [Pseudomonadota bacterium]
MQGTSPLQSAGPLQSSLPLQNVAPAATPGDLSALAVPNSGGLPDGLPQLPNNIPPALALTPAQANTLGSGDVPAINPLIAQLLSTPGNTSPDSLAALVNTVTPPQPPSSTPTAFSPPVTTFTPPVTTGTPAPPVQSPPIVYENVPADRASQS